MAVNPESNDQFKSQNTRPFDVGATVTVSGVQFTVVTNQGNLLTLKPVSARIS
jgi:hypothetical protein